MKVISDYLSKLLRKITTRKETRTKIYRYFLIFSILALIIFGTLIVYWSGGTKNGYTHLLYIPILIAGFTFGVRGGLITGVVAGLLLGPLMPMNVANGVSQPPMKWLVRMFFFSLIGTGTGIMVSLYNINNQLLKKTLHKTSNNYMNTLETLDKIVEKKDEQTSGHSQRVAYNSYLIGEKLGLSDRKLDLLYWSGLLHDLGKIGISDSILLKPSKLTVEEYTKIKKHTVIGHELLESISDDFTLIAKGLRHHHERWDGNGYPDGLEGNDIPIFGRIISVVDVFEALTSYRPYRSPLHKSKALKYIIEHSNEMFDPKIVDIYNELYMDKKIFITYVPHFKREFNVSLQYDLETLWESFISANSLNIGEGKSNFLFNIIDNEMLNHIKNN